MFINDTDSFYELINTTGISCIKSNTAAADIFSQIPICLTVTDNETVFRWRRITVKHGNKCTAVRLFAQLKLCRIFIGMDFRRTVYFIKKKALN